MSASYDSLRSALSGVLKWLAPAVVAIGLVASMTGAASAVTIDFSMASLSGGNGFTVTGYSLTNGNCPGDPACSSIPNAPNVVKIAANTGTFDLLSFLYQFQGTGGNLSVRSDLSLDPIGIITVDNPGNPQTAHTYNVIGSMLAYFTGVSWIEFFTDTEAQVRIDNVLVSAVPVPAGIALGISSLVLLGLMGRRKKGAAAA